MSLREHVIVPERLSAFDVFRVHDAAELDTRSSISERFPATGRLYKYQLRERALWRTRFEQPIFGMATRSAGAILVSFGDSRFATDVNRDGEEGDLFCVTMPVHGAFTLVQDGVPVSATMTQGVMYRPGPRTRLMIGDGSARRNVFLKVQEVEKALEHMLDAHLRKPLEFTTQCDWSGGLSASLKRQLDWLMDEFRRSDGVADNAVALASMTDLLITLALRALPHSYSGRLDAARDGAIPVYVRRAEDFMRANCAEPIRITHVAAAAGCSLRTLGSVFQQFRGTTPLGALHAIRLERVREELVRGAAGGSVAAVSRRYGFTNAARFALAFRRRFGTAPADVLRRASNA